MRKTRNFLKSNWKEIENTDRQKGLKKPPIEKPYNEKDKIINLPSFEEFNSLGNVNLTSVILNRRSRRSFSDSPLTLKELSFLLWSTQGVKKYIPDKEVVFRTVPSAGACHPFETYLVINNVEGLEKGIYRYLSLEHKLFLIKPGDFSKDVIEPHLVNNLLVNLLLFLLGQLFLTEPNGNTPKNPTKLSHLMLDIFAKTFTFLLKQSIVVLVLLPLMTKKKWINSSV